MSVVTFDEAAVWSMGDFRFVSPEAWPAIVASLPNMGNDSKKIIESCDTNGGSSIEFITEWYSCNTRKYQSARKIGAAERYYDLNEMHEHFPNDPCILLLLAECHFIMYDNAGTRKLLLRVRELLQGMSIEDSVLDFAISNVSALAQYELYDIPEEEDEEDFVHTLEYMRPAAWEPSAEPSNLVELVALWKQLQDRSNGVDEFVRYASVTTNELEQVFQLTSGSSMKLARCGLYLSSFCGISKASRHKNPEKIISIIKNTEACYQELKLVVGNEKLFDVNFLKVSHRKILDRDNINIDHHSDGFVEVTVVRMAEFREVACFTIHTADNGSKWKINYCPPTQLQEEMEYFFEQANEVLEGNNLDPYRSAAYLHYLFVRIHPFGDGNGRISRLISSIPLLREGLPPIIVRNEKEYFKVLTELDLHGDIDDFAKFLQKESFEAIKDLLAFDPREHPPQVFMPKSKRQEYEQRLRSRASSPTDLSSMASMASSSDSSTTAPSDAISS